MRRKSLLLMAGVAMFTLACSQVFAFCEEDMMEGMSLSVVTNQASDTNYKYDSAIINTKESMTEFDFFPKTKTVAKHYMGDSTIPSGQDIMSEGICLIPFAQELASR